jgi:CBS domain containing-hemolysin-like protein
MADADTGRGNTDRRMIPEDQRVPTNAADTGGRRSGSQRLSGVRYWLRALRGPRRGDDALRQSLDKLMDPDATEDTPVDRHERMLIENVLKLRDVTAADVMVPRVDIVAADLETPFPELVKLLVAEGHSRLPVYRETLDDVIGMIHVKDVLGYVATGTSVPIADLVRKVLFVAPNTRILDLLLQMRLSRVHMALVVDEFGGIDGLITIEDLVEEIVGEIEDEHDVAEAPHLVERADGTLVADARTPIEEFEQRYEVKLLGGDAEEDVDSLGGLVVMLAGRVPTRGEVIVHPSALEFEILDGDLRRIKRLRLRNLPPRREASGLHP